MLLRELHELIGIRMAVVLVPAMRALDHNGHSELRRSIESFLGPIEQDLIAILDSYEVKRKDREEPMATYETTDLYLSCYLKSRGMRLLDAKRDGRRTTFVFGDAPERGDYVRDFYNDGTVRVNDFTHALQDLKAIVYNV